MKEIGNGTGYPTNFSMRELNVTVEFMEAITQEVHGFYKSPNHSRFSLCPDYGKLFLRERQIKFYEVFRMEQNR